jgi:hypothetical protein
MSLRRRLLRDGLPNLLYSRRNMPIRAFAWDLAWWLMLRVTLRGHTPHQAARMIDDALGQYRPQHGSWTTTTGSTNVTLQWTDPYA